MPHWQTVSDPSYKLPPLVISLLVPPLYPYPIGCYPYPRLSFPKYKIPGASHKIGSSSLDLSPAINLACGTYMESLFCFFASADASTTLAWGPLLRVRGSPLKSLWLACQGLSAAWRCATLRAIPRLGIAVILPFLIILPLFDIFVIITWDILSASRTFCSHHSMKCKLFLWLCLSISIDFWYILTFIDTRSYFLLRDEDFSWWF